MTSSTTKTLPRLRTYGNNPRSHIKSVSSLGYTIRFIPNEENISEKVILMHTHYIDQRKQRQGENAAAGAQSL